MAAADVLTLLEGKWEAGTRPADLYEGRIAARPEQYAGIVMEGLASKKKRVQAGCAELASLVSADHPELLYPHVEVFIRNLRAKEPILRWEAVCTVGNLAAVDDRRVISKEVDTMVDLLSDKSIVLQGHAVRALAKVAARHPKLAPGILAALLGATKHFPGSRVGYIVEATEAFVGHADLVPRIRKFLAPYAQSELAPVSRKARKVLRRIESR
jgi:hypothetical protein